MNIQSTQEMKQSMEKLGYYGTDELALTMRLLFTKELALDGIKSLCLTGLPGVGKTFLPKTMAKLLNYTYIDYTCHLKTGPEQLLEDMNIPAMVRKDADNSVTKGALTRAVEAVNRGEDVILVIDEFDKSARETDYYFLEFLQDGKIETNSFGKLGIKPEDFNKLTVFICKNDERDVHEALMRRFLKFIELTPPDVRTVQTLLTEDVPKADPMLRDAALSLYQMILEDADVYKKIATIQEMKNALREDVMLLQFEESEKNRMHNLINHMAKFPEDRMLLRAKLADQGLIELQEDAQKRNELRISEDALEVFYSQNLPNRVHDIETAIHRLEQLYANGAAGKGELSTGVDSIRLLAADVPEFEEHSVVEHITALGTVTSESLSLVGALPKSTYNPDIMPLTKKAATYADEQYIVAELQLNRKRGKLPHLMDAITSAKSRMEIMDVTHDGFILSKTDYNQIGLIHVMETEGMPPRLYIVSAKPVITDEQFHKALQAMPRNIQKMTDIIGLDVNIVTEKEFDFVGNMLDHVYTLSEDHTQVVGNKNGVVVRYDSEDQLMKMKVTRTNAVPVEGLIETVYHLAASNNEKASQTFNSRLRVVTLNELFTLAKENDDLRVGKTEDLLQKFENLTIEGVDTRVFAKNGMDERFGVESHPDAEKFLAEAMGKTIEEFTETMAVIKFDGDQDFKVYHKDDDGDENSNWTKFLDGYGETIESFVEKHQLTKQEGPSSVVEKAEALSQLFITKQQQSA